MSEPTGASRRDALLVRHKVSVFLLFLTAVIATQAKTPGLQALCVAVAIGLMASMYMERCLNCGGVIWLRRGRFVFNRTIGPFIPPQHCGQCGSPDFESPPTE
jgi:hypothetical protein